MAILEYIREAHPSPAMLVVLIPSAFIVYKLILFIYRTSPLHPLSKFPGNKFAAGSMLYEMYYDIFPKKGRFAWEVDNMHKKYGPIIRINPHELAINDPDFYDVIYTAERKYDKYGWGTKQFGTPLSMISTVEADLHKRRRGAAAPYFSRASVVRLEGVIIEKLLKLIERVGSSEEDETDLALAFRAFTTDVVTQFTMAQSFGFLDHPTYNAPYFRGMRDLSQLSPVFKQFIWIYHALIRIPMWAMKYIDKTTYGMLIFQQQVRDQVDDILHLGPTHQFEKTTVFHDLAFKSKLPLEERSAERLFQEGVLFMFAGSETTAYALATTIYHLLANPEMLKRLLEEIDQAIPTIDRIPKWQELERLTYLNAVIAEGLRFSHGVVDRLPRVAPTWTIKYKDWEIPAGTPVSMNPYFIHTNPDIFPEPLKFSPERWLESNTEKEMLARMKKFHVPFSQGPRMCLGINLGYAELYLGLALMFRRLELRLASDVTIEDVEVAHDFFVPYPKLDSKGTRILAKPRDK